MKNPMQRKLTNLEKLLLELLSAVVFYAEPHDKFCAKTWGHDPKMACTCARGQHHIRANILLNKFGCGYSQWDIDKKWPVHSKYSQKKLAEMEAKK